MGVSMIGLDTAKSVFQVHGMHEAGKPELKRKLRRSELIPFFEKEGTCTVVMGACGAAHHWARMLTGLGHTIRLVLPETVRRRERRTMRPMPRRSAKPPLGLKFVAVNSVEQQGIPASSQIFWSDTQRQRTRMGLSRQRI
jgi:transposase